jgi:hypothetical protein
MLLSDVRLANPLHCGCPTPRDFVPWRFSDAACLSVGMAPKNGWTVGSFLTTLDNALEKSKARYAAVVERHTHAAGNQRDPAAYGPT